MARSHLKTFNYLVCLFAASAVGHRLLASDPPSGQLEAPRPRAGAVQQSCRGSIVRITPRTIMIQPDTGGPKRSFVPSAILAKGDYPRNRGLDFMYKIEDLKLGDRILIEYKQVNRVDICEAICIRRRPGGRVPAGHYPPDTVSRPHEIAQAYQDFEEKGTPLPRYLIPLSPDVLRHQAPPPHESPHKKGKMLGRDER